MARDYGRIKITIWHNEDFTSLSSKAQQLYFYLITQARLDMAGVVQWRPRMAMKSASDLTEKSVADALAELEAEFYVLLDEETDELLVRSFIRNDEVLRSPNMAIAMGKAWRGLDSDILRGVISFEVNRIADENSSLKGLDKCEEVLAGPFIDPRGNPFAKGSTKGCRTTTTTSTALTTTTTSTADNASPEFDAFWSSFPSERKSNKPGCRKKFAQAIRTTDPQKIIAAAAAYRDDPNREAQFTVNPHKWLNEERWESGPLPTRAATGSQQRLQEGLRLVQRSADRPAVHQDPFMKELGT